MKPKRIILIRHGESEANIDKSIHQHKPDYTMELTPKGIEQADTAGKELKSIIGGDESAFFYVSPYWRTRGTFEQIAKHFTPAKIKWTEEPRLREQDWGHLVNPEQNIQVDKERDSFGTFYYRIPDGESAADVYDRVSDFFGTLHRDFEKEYFPDNAVIVTHGMTLRLFLMKWFHWTVEEFEEYANPQNCQKVILEKTLFRYKLVSELRKHKVAHGYQRPINLKAKSTITWK
jgi:broad specificity phosphatase PhoE